MPGSSGAGTVCSAIWLEQVPCVVQLLLRQDHATCSTCSGYSGICIACTAGPRPAEAVAKSGILGVGKEGGGVCGPDPAHRLASHHSSGPQR